MSKTIIAYYKGTKRENKKARWLDRVICFATRSRFSHCEIVYDYSSVTKRGFCYSSSPRDGGVRSKLIDFSSGHWELFEVPSPRTTDQILDFFQSKHGVKYDWLGAIGAQYPIFKNDPKRQFCSEIIADCLDHGNPWKYTPQDLYKYYTGVHRQVL